ncbi:MAG: type II secretion system protein [bacterium]
MNKRKSVPGFTLIEILVVVALIAILAAITFIAINPSKNFADTRNAQRSSDVSQILNAVTQYTSEQGKAIGDFGAINTCGVGVTKIGTTTSSTSGEWVNLTTLLVDSYIVGIPSDPSGYSATDSGYTICKTTGGRIQVDAPHAENSKTISVRR